MTILPKFRGRTTLDIGTSFEKHALKYLNNQLYMDLRRVGGAGDGGIDLRGWWWLPRSPRMSGDMTEAKNESVRRVRVIVQCKAEKKSLGPRNVRELEGVMGNLRYHSNPSSTSTLSLSSSSETLENSLNPYEQDIAVLISQSGFTKSTMLYSTSSNIPLMLVHLPGGQPAPQSDHKAEEEGLLDDGGQEKEVKSLWWNKALSEGVLGNEIELRRTIGPKGVGVGLWLGGREIGRCGPKGAWPE